MTTVEANLALNLYGMGVAVGDYDADGWVDLFITAVGPNRMLRNVEGTFEDVTSSAGVAGEDDRVEHEHRLLRFRQRRRPGSVRVQLRPLVGEDRPRAQLHTERHRPRLRTAEELSRLLQLSLPQRRWRRRLHRRLRERWNPGRQRLHRRAGGKGSRRLLRSTSMAMAGSTSSSPTTPCRISSSGTSRTPPSPRSAVATGVAYDGMGNATGAMGIDTADYRNDAQLAVVIGNFANETTSFYVMQQQAWEFAEMSDVEGIGSPSRLRAQLRSVLLRLRSRRSDSTSSRPTVTSRRRSTRSSRASTTSNRPSYSGTPAWTAGPASWRCHKETLGGLSRPIVGRGAAYADIDGDGDLDALLTQTGGAPMLLRNDQTADHHWLRVKLVGKGQNRDAIGAWAILEAGGITQRRQVMPTRSYLSQVELPLTFGLGDVSKIDSPPNPVARRLGADRRG